ncbi:MAG: thermonuclease family protein, partial [Chloroflexi bacterium]|nr:thermonuclease family protein [Chloroflexota bacterium]
MFRARLFVLASAKAKELLGGQQVRLILDPTQGDRDRYGRLLSYVEIGDRTDFGLWMIQNGYAHEYTYNIPYQRQAAYKAAYAEARTKSVGLWASETCNGDTKQAAVPRSQTAGSPPVGLALQEAAAPTPTPKPVPTAVPSPTIPPSPTAVPTRAPTATSTTVTEGQLALDILSVTSPVRPGGQ